MALWEYVDDVRDMAVTVAWCLWYERNTMLHTGSTWYAGGILDTPERVLHEFKAANEAHPVEIDALPMK